MKRLRRWALLTAITLGFCLTLGECGLRVAGIEYPPWYRLDRRLGWTLRPGATGTSRDEGLAHLAITADGRRDVEYPRHKPANVFRIAVLGDSFSEAQQVEQDATFWSVLAREAAQCERFAGTSVETINFGVSSFGTANELLLLQDQVWSYEPDLVLLQFFTGNDFRDNHRKLDHVTMRPYFERKGDDLVLDVSTVDHPFLLRNAWRTVLAWSRTAQLIERARNKTRVALAHPGAGSGADEADGGPFREPRTTEWKEAWDVTLALLGKMRTDIETDHHRSFLMVIMDPAALVDPHPEARKRLEERLGVSDLLYAERRLQAFARAEHIDTLFLTPPMIEYATSQRKCLHGFPNGVPCGGHWNEEGHRLAGQLIARKICQSKPAAPDGDVGMRP